MAEFDALEYIEKLNQSDDINSTPKVPLPSYGDENFVFISYSHKDYKAVYADLAQLYERGVNFWYDRGLTPGINWKNEVTEKLRSDKCAGVIFYMSKNLFMSESVFYEISNTMPDDPMAENNEEYAIGKKHFAVNLENELPAKTILLAAADLVGKREAADIVKKLPKLVSAFPDEETYVPYDTEHHIADIVETLRSYDNVLRASETAEVQPVPRDLSNLEPGMMLDDRYRIVAKIGQGGMGKAYLAENVRLSMRCVVKVFSYEGEERYLNILRDAFEHEKTLMKSFNHQGLPRVTDAFSTDKYLVIVMDYIEGETLDGILKMNGPQPEKEVICWAKQLCEILSYLHDRQKPIIYRDLKPYNIILQPDGKVILIDFGAAMEYEESATADGISMGTPGYAAPEQFGGLGQSDCRTDLYALGATMYQLLTGDSPRKTLFELPPVRSVNAKLSAGIEYIISKCTELNPANRYGSAMELLKDLENVDKLGKQSGGLFAKLFGAPRPAPADMYRERVTAIKQDATNVVNSPVYVTESNEDFINTCVLDYQPPEENS